MQATSRWTAAGIDYRQLGLDELRRICEIDRTLRIDALYVQHGSELGVAQLAYLHVSDGYWARGFGSRLADELERIAHDPGVTSMVVSATPSLNTVRFYSVAGSSRWPSRSRSSSSSSPRMSTCGSRSGWLIGNAPALSS